MKKYKLLILSLVLCCIYIGFIFWDKSKGIIGEIPVIETPTKPMVSSVKDSTKKLLKEVKAYDKEDGDLTKQVFIDSISPFNEDNHRMVTFAVFDSDDNLVRKTRSISYTDYKKPKLTLVQPVLVSYLGDKAMFKSFVKATSSVDGNISANVSVDRIYLNDDEYYIDYSVSDSTGGSDSLTLKVDFLDPQKRTNITISLTDYLIEVNKGTDIHALDYVKSIEKHHMTKNDLIDDIDITTNYNPNKKGIYDVLYEISLPNGDYGMSKLSIIVK